MKMYISTMIKRLLKGLLRFLLSVVIWIVVYGLATILGTLIPTKKEPIENTSDVTVYLISNGFHTEWVFPIRYQTINWLKRFGSDFTGNYQHYTYLAIGWGDRDFYMNSKTYPSLYTTYKALLMPSESILQVTFYKNIPRSWNVIRLRIELEQYETLYSFMDKQFKKDFFGNYELIQGKPHQARLFLKSWGAYHCLNTCNNWTNRGLKKIGHKTGVWTPLAWGVLYRQEGAIHQP